MNDDMIRPLRRDDLTAAQRLIAAVDLFPPELLPDMADAYLAGGSSDRWLITETGEGLAYAAPEQLTDGTWNLLLLAVSPARQRHGLGRALVTSMVAVLRSTGARLLLVETSGMPDFSGQREFYRRLGFEQEARIRNFYAAGDDKIVFTMSLHG
jgi:ribosomal protein S18 acetylase RimI-like enzyme